METWAHDEIEPPSGGTSIIALHSNFKRKMFRPTGTTLYLVPQHCPYMVIYVQCSWNAYLIASFWAFNFVYGAKVIYFSWRIQIRNFLARAHFRARCARRKFWDIPQNSFFFGFWAIFRRAQRARKCAHAKCFFRFEIFVRRRWLLHLERIK